jgi:opacity protein-like surface antigen
MRTSILTVLSTLVLATALVAQDAPRFTFYGGVAHSLQNPNTGILSYAEEGEDFRLAPCTPDGADILGSNLQRIFCDRRDFHGFDTALTYNLNRSWGVRGDFSYYANKDRTVDTFGEGAEQHVDTNRFTERTYLLLGGLEYGHSMMSSRVRPFAHALIGAARQTVTDRQTSTGPFNFTIRDEVTSFAMKIGGGIDMSITPHVDIRLIEANYVPIFAGKRHTPGDADFDQTAQGETANNVTFSFGIVVH